MVAVQAALEKSGARQLAGLVKALRSRKGEVRTIVRRGRPASELVALAEELGSDLIVMSTHGLTGWRRAMLGSVTEEVVRHAPCPVLVVRRPARPRVG